MTPIPSKSLFASLLLTACSVWSLTLEHVAFHHSFEQGREADLSRGSGVPIQVLGQPELVTAPGRDGQVLQLRSGKDALVFELPGNLTPAQGAISFHLSAVDWDGSKGDALQVLLHTNGGDQQLVVQTLWPWGSLFMPLYDAGQLIGGFPAGRSCTAPLKQGEDLENVLKSGYWYHYLITWRDGYQAIYLNGKLMNQARLPGIRLRHLGDRLILGWDRETGRIFWDPGCDDPAAPLAAKNWTSLLDDVTILSAFIFPHEAAKIHEYGAVEFARRAEPSALAIEAEFYQTRAELAVQLIAPGSQPKDVALEIETAEGQPVRREAIQVPAGETLRLVELAMPELAPGAYRVRGAMASGFQTEWQPFERVIPDWLGNNHGKADVVLDPWTPVTLVQQDALQVEVWGRTYRFTGPLPDQIESQGRALLAGPVRWHADQAPIAWSELKVESQTPTRAVLTSQATAGGYAVNGETRVEYDGFTWSTFRFRADQPRQLQSLRVDIPLTAAACTFLQYPTRRDCWFPKKADWASDFQPYIFVGNDTVGLQWYAESDQWWHGKEAGRAIQVVKEGDHFLLRLAIVRDPVEMPAEFTFGFGLMASPVRPRPVHWRGWGTPTKYRLGHLETYKPMALDYSWWSVSPGWLIPNQRDPQVRDPRGTGGALWLPFTSTTFRGMRAFSEKELTRYLPIWQQFAPEWRSLPELVNLGKPGDWNQIVINPAPSFVDRYAWEVQQLFSGWPACQGLYFDGYAGKYASANLKAGFGYRDRSGTIRPTYPILAGRELMRRIYALRLQHKPEGALMIHPATSLFLPVLSHSTTIYDGEFMGWSDITHAINTKGLTAGLTDDKTRFLLNYKALGLVPTIDTRWVTRRALDQKGTMSNFSSWHRLAYARFMVDDVHAVNLGAYSQMIMTATDWWGLADADVEYLPHYATKPAATTGWADRSSCWVKRDQGKVLIATLNNSGYSRNPGRLAREGKHGYELVLDLGQLGLEPAKFRATDAESLGALEIPITGDNVLSLTMDPNEFMLIALERTK